MKKIILASASPRRAEIMKNLDIDFKIIPSEYVEEHKMTDFSYEYTENLAYNKALDVAKRTAAAALVIGADTVVVIGDEILGKPQDQTDAKRMLKKLSGATHYVVTSIAIIDTTDLSCKTQSTTTYVTFNDLSDEQIEYYITNYKPFDKAGSYGIQELPPGYVAKFEGSYNNVVGLPDKELVELLNSMK